MDAKLYDTGSAGVRRGGGSTQLKGTINILRQWTPLLASALFVSRITRKELLRVIAADQTDRPRVLRFLGFFAANRYGENSTLFEFFAVKPIEFLGHFPIDPIFVSR